MDKNINKNKKIIIMNGMEAMTERPSYRWENKEYLLEVFMKQLGITEEDLDNEPSWIKAKVREVNIDKVLED